MRYLLDTNICIYLIKNHPPEIFQRFREHSPEDVAISTVTLFELQYGVEKSQHRKRSGNALSKFIFSLNLIDLDHTAAVESAVIRAQLEKMGMPIGPYDLLIAGIAKSRDMVLVTNNTKEFKRIQGLGLENWVSLG